MDRLSSLGVQNAVALAKSLGLSTDAPVVLKDGSNVMVHLAPAPVVARVATSTGLVRPDVSQWLARELSVARFLEQQGAPVIPPSREIDPGPHAYDGYAISFWTYVEHDRNKTLSVRDAAPLLRELHTALAGYPGELPYLGVVLDEIPHWLRYLGRNRGLSATDITMLREAQWRVAETLRKPADPSRPLHGDAHVRNLLKTPKGLVWCDFEDTCRGPVGWDLACMIFRLPARVNSDESKAALEAYGRLAGYHYSWDELNPYLDARELEGVVWTQVQALRFPDRRQLADEMLQAWRRRL